MKKPKFAKNIVDGMIALNKVNLLNAYEDVLLEHAEISNLIGASLRNIYKAGCFDQLTAQRVILTFIDLKNNNTNILAAGIRLLKTYKIMTSDNLDKILNQPALAFNLARIFQYLNKSKMSMTDKQYNEITKNKDNAGVSVYYLAESLKLLSENGISNNVMHMCLDYPHQASLIHAAFLSLKNFDDRACQKIIANPKDALITTLKLNLSYYLGEFIKKSATLSGGGVFDSNKNMIYSAKKLLASLDGRNIKFDQADLDILLLKHNPLQDLIQKALYIKTETDQLVKTNPSLILPLDLINLAKKRKEETKYIGRHIL